MSPKDEFLARRERDGGVPHNAHVRDVPLALAALATLVAGILALASIPRLQAASASWLRSHETISLVVALALALVLAVISLVLLRVEHRRRANAEAALQRVHDELDDRIAARTAELARSNELLREEVAGRSLVDSELEDNRARLSGVIESAMDAIITIDSDHRVVLFNHAAEMMFQRTAVETTGQPLELLLPHRSRDQHRSHVEHFARTGTTSRRMGKLGAVSGLRADGTEFPIEASISLLHTAGGTLATVILRDITDRLQAEQLLREAKDSLEKRVAERTAALEAATQRAEAGDRTKSAFLAQMSHELRTPLNSILGFAGILRQGLAGPVEAEQALQLDFILKSARHLLALINDILDISKIEANQLEVTWASFALGDAVTKTVEMVSPLAKEKGLQLTLSLPPAADVIWSDRRCVEQVMLNLLSNALKFTERGSIVVERRSQPPWWVVEVSDTGIGIDAADLDRIFDPFQQVENPEGRVTEGTGLGLAISKRLLQALGGEIHVRSRLREGTTFEVRLPTTAADPSAAKPPGVGQPT